MAWWSKNYDYLSTVALSNGYRDFASFSCVRDGDARLFLYQQRDESRLHPVSFEEAKRLSAFLRSGLATIESDIPVFYGISTLGKVGRLFARGFSTYHGYHIRSARILEDTSFQGVADFCLALEDGDARYGFTVFYQRGEAVSGRPLALDSARELCAYIEDITGPAG